jgi:hypothetical protein
MKKVIQPVTIGLGRAIAFRVGNVLALELLKYQENVGVSKRACATKIATANGVRPPKKNRTMPAPSRENSAGAADSLNM